MLNSSCTTNRENRPDTMATSINCTKNCRYCTDVPNKPWWGMLIDHNIKGIKLVDMV
jgi:hypothetical protein